MFGLAGVRKWVYPQSVKGRFQRLHRWTGLGLQAILFLTPWIHWGGHPLVRLDLPARRLYLAGGLYTPADTAFLVILGLGSAFALFFFTSLFGRLWCGYACPQTVFLEEWVRPIDRWIEGDRGQRMALDKGKWTAKKVGKKALKWTLFALVAGAVSMTLVSYFAGARELWTGGGGSVEYGFAAVIGTILFFDFAWFREQLCNYVCPYARFQGALTDDKSMVIAYDTARGEPRKGEGACIDCNKCVAVCPQGIDIRNGYQLDCVNCARCVDACEGVMDKLHQPSLVRYTTQSGNWTLLRGRTLAYGGLLAALATGMVVLSAQRHELDGMVSRAPGSLFYVDADGWVRNSFNLRLTSRETATDTFHVSVDGLPEGAQVMVPPVTLEPGQQVTVPLIVRVPPDTTSGRTLPIKVNVTSRDDLLQMDATFKTDAEGS